MAESFVAFGPRILYIARYLGLDKFEKYCFGVRLKTKHYSIRIKAKTNKSMWISSTSSWNENARLPGTSQIDLKVKTAAKALALANRIKYLIS